MVDNPGDLARRVSQRRRELQMSLEEVASRALMDVKYLQALETSPSPQLSRAALWRLASALDTTVDSLTGGGTQQPPGRTGPSTRPLLQAMSRQECESLIGQGGIGRVLFVEPRGPAAFPVNYKVLGGDIVFRTAPAPAFEKSLEDGRISFEVDRIDDALSEGWSVLVSGRGYVISDSAELAEAQAAGISPWAGGERDVFVRVVAEEVTGRRIRAG
jgi:nitroimidazol reductase NimA-like FMN-containing flavoprotein (pyridoxamine 5'-phosphate oxidase superfamily)